MLVTHNIQESRDIIVNYDKYLNVDDNIFNKDDEKENKYFFMAELLYILTFCYSGYFIIIILNKGNLFIYQLVFNHTKIYLYLLNYLFCIIM